MEIGSVKEVSEEYALEHITQFLQDENMMALVNPDVTVQLQRVQEAMKKRSVMLLPEDYEEAVAGGAPQTSPPATPSRSEKPKVEKKKKTKTKKGSKKEKRKSSSKRELMEED